MGGRLDSNELLIYIRNPFVYCSSSSHLFQSAGLMSEDLPNLDIDMDFSIPTNQSQLFAALTTIINSQRPPPWLSPIVPRLPNCAKDVKYWKSATRGYTSPWLSKTWQIGKLGLNWELDGIWPFVRDDCEQMGKLCDFCSHLSSLLHCYWLCCELENMEERRIRISISYVVQRTMSEKLRLECLRVRMSAEGDSNTWLASYLN